MNPPPDPPLRRLRIWQQNLNKSLGAADHFRNSCNPNKYDIALIQEPYIDFRGVGRANRRFASIYPPSHAPHHGATCSVIFIGTQLPSSSWTAIPIESPDVTAVELRGEYGMIRIFNIYNDCDHNGALDAVRNYLRSP
ncbi:hypothetical protein C8R43DRAFT_893080, partial [Mycena crocata]